MDARLLNALERLSAPVDRLHTLYKSPPNSSMHQSAFLINSVTINARHCRSGGETYRGEIATYEVPERKSGTLSTSGVVLAATGKDCHSDRSLSLAVSCRVPETHTAL